MTELEHQPLGNINLPALEAVFDFSIIGSALVEPVELAQEIKTKYPHIKVVSETDGGKYDLVIGSKEEWADATEHTLIFSGEPINSPRIRDSEAGPPRLDRRVETGRHATIIQQLESQGFAHWPEVGDRLGFPVFRAWKFLKPHSSYFVQQLNSDDANHHKLHDAPGLYYTTLQEAFLKLTQIIKQASLAGKPMSIVRASDGDYYFLRKVEIGSAKPGRRALTVGYDEVNIPLFRKLFWDNDIISISIEPSFYKSWKKYLFYESFDKFFWKLNFKFRGQNVFKYLNFAFDKTLGWLISSAAFLRVWLSIFPLKASKQQREDILQKHQTPMEAVYTLVPSKWIFKNFKNQVGIIAGTYKCELIKLLMQRQEYRDYIDMDEFTDYIEVPQIGAADNLENLAYEIGGKVQNSRAKIFLVGVGSVKLGLLPLLKKYSNAIFIDVGAGIDALAGVVCQERPYFCQWTDYRINGYDYSKVDFMDQGNPAWNKPEYKTKWIE